MAKALVVPQIVYNEELEHNNIFRKSFSSLTDREWSQLLKNSITEKLINNIEFPAYPDPALQNRIHGHSAEVSIDEATNFYSFVKENTYKSIENSKNMVFLDFASGWGRIVRLFMRDFNLPNIYGYEPNFLFCAIARSLNPYACFLTGDYMPDGILQKNQFNLVVGWSIFSHLSYSSAVAWLRDMQRIVKPGGWCVFTTWGERFLRRLVVEEQALRDGKEIHWYSQVCIKAAQDVNARLLEYNSGEFVWFTSGQSKLYGEAFLGKQQLLSMISDNDLMFDLNVYDDKKLAQDVFVLQRR